MQTEENVLIGGFMLGGRPETSDVIVRALGPSLNRSGITSERLADPTLELRDGNGTLVRGNDNWQEDPAQAAQISGRSLAPENPAESAIFATLAPGDYTSIIAGKADGIGIGLVEIYNLR